MNTKSQSPEVEIAVLKNQMDNLDKRVETGFREIKGAIENIAKEVKRIVDDGDTKYITKNQIEEHLKNLKMSDDRIEKIATTRSWLMAGAGTLIGVVVSVITALLIYFFTNK